MTGNQEQAPDGSWRPAQSIGWQEEHSPLEWFIFWLRGLEHCNDREGQTRSRLKKSGP